VKKNTPFEKRRRTILEGAKNKVVLAETKEGCTLTETNQEFT